jgi:hypothetical protein
MLEVLAAVLVLAMFFTVLAEQAIHGLRAEGENRRRLEASLLADDLMMEIESGMLNGDVPPIGREEDEDDLYTLVLEVRPLDLTALFPPEALLDDSVAATLLGDDPDESPAREIEITVTWFEIEDERRVQRKTFAFDTDGASDLDGAAAGGGASGSGYLESAARRKARNQSMLRHGGQLPEYD